MTPPVVLQPQQQPFGHSGPPIATPIKTPIPTTIQTNRPAEPLVNAIQVTHSQRHSPTSLAALVEAAATQSSRSATVPTEVEADEVFSQLPEIVVEKLSPPKSPREKKDDSKAKVAGPAALNSHDSSGKENANTSEPDLAQECAATAKIAEPIPTPAFAVANMANHVTVSV